MRRIRERRAASQPDFDGRLAAYLVAAGAVGTAMATEAEAVYEKDLQQYPHNGWSTLGLIQALDAQGRKADADMHREHFKAMWQLADVELTGSRLGVRD